MTAIALRRLTLVFALTGPSTACGGDESDPSMTAGAPQPGVGATATAGDGGTNPLAGSANEQGGAGGGAGRSTNGGMAGNAQAGSGGQLSGEQLKEATYVECDNMCRLVKAACPASDLSGCTDTCHQQADNYAATGQCAMELYRTAACVSKTQTVADITCTPGGPGFRGCQSELTAYNSCVGG